MSALEPLREDDGRPGGERLGVLRVACDHLAGRHAHAHPPAQPVRAFCIRTVTLQSAPALIPPSASQTIVLTRKAAALPSLRSRVRSPSFAPCRLATPSAAASVGARRGRLGGGGEGKGRGG